MWQLGPHADDPEWREIDTPFDNDLMELCQTKVGAYAIGEGGILAGNRNDNGWEVVLDDGPNARDNKMNAMDVTDDGKRLWFLGSSGAIGCYDVETRRKYDYSYPKEMTSTWNGITVCGPAGKEKGLAANGSGEVMPFTIDGFDVDWGVAKKPVGGKASHIAALASTPEGVGFAVDTSGQAYKTTKSDGWKDIGIVNAQVKFYDIYAGSHGKVYVSAGDGRLYRYDDSYHHWTPISVGNETLEAFDLYHGDMVVLGGHGTFFQRQFGGQRWRKIHTPTEATLYDVRLGKPYDVAVGANGTVLHRPRGQQNKPHAGSSPDGDQYDGRGELYDGDGNTRGQSTSSNSGSSSSGSSSGSSNGSSSGSSSGSTSGSSSTSSN